MSGATSAGAPALADDAEISAADVDDEPPAKPMLGGATPTLVVLDRAGTLHLLDEQGHTLATREGRGTDLVAHGTNLATFEPPRDDLAGSIRMFTLSGSALTEGPPLASTSERGGLVTLVDEGAAVLAWEEAERASLLVASAQGSVGMSVGVPTSFRRAFLDDGSASLEVLVTASGVPRIDRFRIGPGGSVTPLDDFPVAVAPDAEARMVAAADTRLLVSLEGGAVLLRDEAGGEEVGPPVAGKATLEDVAARDGRLALLLGAPPRLVLRDLSGVYTNVDLPGPSAWDPRPSHRLAFRDAAVFVITGEGLARVGWPPENTTTAEASLEPWLAGGVAVVALPGTE